MRKKLRIEAQQRRQRSVEFIGEVARRRVGEIEVGRLSWGGDRWYWIEESGVTVLGGMAWRHWALEELVRRREAGGSEWEGIEGCWRAWVDRERSL